MKQVSKLRNVYGDPKKEKFTDVLMAEVTSEGSLLAVNSTFLAVSWQGVGGCVGVFDANTPNRISSEIPLIRGHDSYVSDVKFSPFRTNLLATGSDDTTIKLWEIPQDFFPFHRFFLTLFPGTSCSFPTMNVPEISTLLEHLFF